MIICCSPSVLGVACSYHNLVNHIHVGYLKYMFNVVHVLK